MRRVVFNQKGGVGKSSIAVNLAAEAARQGRRTLVLDLDPQGNTTQYLLGQTVTEDGQIPVEGSAADFFEQHLSFRLGAKGLDAFVTPTPFDGLDVIAASPDLAELQDKLAAKHKIYKLRDALDALDGYDEVFIDTPPAMGFYTLSALIASDRVLIPFDCDEFARQALYALLDTAAEVRADHNPALEVEGIVVNGFQKNAKLPRRVVEELESEGLPVLDTKLPQSVKMRESHEASAPLPYFAVRHPLGEAFAELWQEVDTH